MSSLLRPKTAASSSRSPVGVWQLTVSVSRPVLPSSMASVARGSMGQGATRWLTKSSLTTCAALRKAAAVAVASPWRISQARLPLAAGHTSGAFARKRGAGIRHRRQRLVADVDRLDRVARLAHARRDHRRDGFTDVPHRVDRERVPRRGRRRRAVGAAEIADSGSGCTPARTRSCPVSTATTPGIAAAAPCRPRRCARARAASAGTRHGAGPAR